MQYILTLLLLLCSCSPVYADESEETTTTPPIVIVKDDEKVDLEPVTQSIDALSTKVDAISQTVTLMASTPEYDGDNGPLFSSVSYIGVASNLDRYVYAITAYAPQISASTSVDDWITLYFVSNSSTVIPSMPDTNTQLRLSNLYTSDGLQQATFAFTTLEDCLAYSPAMLSAGVTDAYDMADLMPLDGIPDGVKFYTFVGGHASGIEYSATGVNKGTFCAHTVSGGSYTRDTADYIYSRIRGNNAYMSIVQTIEAPIPDDPDVPVSGSIDIAPLAIVAGAILLALF